jgi:ATP-dependent DNA ligase
MSSVFDILEKLESDNSRLFKEALLAEHRGNDLLRRVFVAELDPYTNYYVSKFRLAPPREAGADDDAALESFLTLIGSQLSTRAVTGNAAKDLVEAAFEGMTALQQKWCQRILLRNLRVGASEKLVNRTWPDAVQKFGVQLAEVLEAKVVDGTLRVKDPVAYPVFVEPKLDGLRCVAVKSGGKVTMYTRNGTVLETLPTIRRALESHPLDNIVLDAEALGSDWSESASVVMSRKRAKDDSNMVLHVFDVVPLDLWNTRGRTRSFTDRRNFLEKVFITGLPDGTRCIRLTPSIIAQEDGDILSYYQKCLSEGFEGVMVKRPEAPYAWKRNDSVLKLKPVSTHEGVIVGWHKGGAKGKRADSFGGWEVLLPNGVSTRVGSGLNDAIRAEVEAAGPDTYIGRIAECEAQEVTSDGKMRFPIFIRFRDPSDVDPRVLAAYEAWKS